MASKKDNSVLILGGAAVAAFVLFGSKSAAAAPETPGEFTPTVSDDQPPKKYSPTDFVKTFYPAALESQQRTGVPYQVTLAQAAVESGWGKSAYGNNFFGIKADKNWKGDVQILREWGCGKTGNAIKDGILDEVIAIYPPGDPKGHPACGNLYSYRVNAKFRKYPKAADSFADHGYFLKYNHRYADAFNYTNDPKQFTIKMAAAGYASAPTYAADINSMIDNINKILAA